MPTPPPSFSPAAPSAYVVTIAAHAPARSASPMHYGLMTEEINHSYDGGLYAELVRNRSFRDHPEKPEHWSAVSKGGATCTMKLDTGRPFNEAIPVSLRMEVSASEGDAHAGVANHGYWGIPVKPGTRYKLVVHAWAEAEPVKVEARLENDTGARVFSSDSFEVQPGGWSRHELILETSPLIAPTASAKLSLTLSKSGTLWLGFASLFPPTWNDRPNGLRADLMQMLVDMKPAFLRFPGGNYLEGHRIEDRFPWKETLGPVTERPGHQGPWGYRSTDGMGLLEFLLWCEDMGAEPLLGVYAGYALNGDYVKPGPDLEPFVQEALDEIEYIIGGTDTKWGAVRARDGHPEPFKLRYVEIGNEDWFDKSLSYDGRFAQFEAAIKARWPHLKCISSVGSEQPVEKRVHSVRPDMLDEHFYLNTETFLQRSRNWYEPYDRSGPEVFVGEWAAHETSFPPWDPRSRALAPTPNLWAAIGDAAWMAAMERNSDHVKLQCYAPLLANVNGYQWRPNLIGYDGLRAFGSPSYHAFCLFSTAFADELLQIKTMPEPLHASATRDSSSGTLHVKLVNPMATPATVTLAGDGMYPAGAVALRLLAAAPDATNSIIDPTRVVPTLSERAHPGGDLTVDLPPTSIAVLTLTPTSIAASH